MKIKYLYMVTLLCLFVTACSNSDKQYDIVESTVITPDTLTPSDQDMINPDATAPNESPPAADSNSPGNSSETEVDLSSYFDGFSGAAVFLDKSGNYTFYNKTACELRVSPCSTFKIISTLAAFEYDVVTPTQSVIAWDGTKWTYEAWNKDLTITEAFQSSCVWYYRKLIDQIGKENMTDFINILNYGNCDISQWEGSEFNSNPLIDGFWLESSLLISPKEQVDVIQRIFEEKTGIDESNISALKEMMYKGDTVGGIKIYGKTGTGRGGWFIGFYESDGDNTYFAVYLNEQEEVNGLKAQEITYSIMQGYLFKEPNV